MPRPRLAFAARRGGKHAASWIVKGWGQEQFSIARDNADGLHFTRHRDGFVSLCGIDQNRSRHYLPDDSSRTVREGTVLITTILQPPIVCEEAHPKPEVRYVDSPHPEVWIVHRVFYESDHDSGNIPGTRLPNASLTGTVNLNSGGTVIVVSQLSAVDAGTMTMQGKIFMPRNATSAVGGFAFQTPDGLVMMEGLNEAPPDWIAD